MIDRKAIKIGEQVDRSVAPGANILQEGSILCEAIVGGVSCVSVVATPVGTEQIAGFSILPYSLPTQTVANEQYVVPAVGSLIIQLRNNNLVAGSERAQVPGASDLTIDETNFSATPPTGTVKVDLVGGRLKFAAGNVGITVNFLYSYQLTAQMAFTRFGERSINNRFSVQDLALVSVAKGYLEISTDQFDGTKDYTTVNAATPLRLGANGIITIGGAGPVIPGAKVLAAPGLTGQGPQGAFLRISALIA